MDTEANISDRCRELTSQIESGERLPRETDLLKVGAGCHENCAHCTNKPIPNFLRLNNGQQLALVGKIRQRVAGMRLFIYPDEIDNNQHLIDELARHNQHMILTSATCREIPPDDETFLRLHEAGITDIPITLFASAQEQQEITNQSPEKYQRILRNMTTLARMGFNVRANNVLHRRNVDSMSDLTKTADSCGAASVRFTSLRYLGRARNLDPSYFLTADDATEVVQTVDDLRRHYPKDRFKISLAPTSFGPNFYGKTPAEAAARIRERNKSRCQNPNDFPYACPSIDNNYLGYNLFTGDVHWCFLNIAHPDMRIGKFDAKTGAVNLDTPVDFTRERLRERIHGICSPGECDYSEVCMGMCRSTAYSSALLQGDPDPLYASMPWCQTRIRAARP